MLLLTLAAAPLLGRSADGARVATGAAAEGAVVGASTDDAVQIRELMAQTTSTFLAATTADTSTTTSTVGEVPAADAEDRSEPAAATTTTAAPTSTTIAAAAATAEPEPTTTTVAPTTTTTEPPPSTTTTTAPSTTTTTAAPETAESSGDDEQYAYDDPRSTQVWYDLADCEAGGDWSIDTGNGYYGGLQFSLGSWEAVGGSGYPHEHPAETQIEMGRRLQDRQGWDAWPHCSEKLGLE